MARPQTPLVTVDTVIELADRTDRPVVLVRRRKPPHGWALPGGFVDVGESTENAAVREAAEETGLHVGLEILLGCYSDPRRDPRGHMVSIVYVAAAEGEPRGGDDVGEARAFAPDSPPELAFDHDRILADYREYRRTGRPPPLSDRGGGG